MAQQQAEWAAQQAAILRATMAAQGSSGSGQLSGKKGPQRQESQRQESVFICCI